MESRMAQSCITSGVGQMLDTMISLPRLTPLQRVIVAGSDSMELYLGLRQRGFVRATTLTLCRHKRAQHAVGFIAGQVASPGSLTGIESDLEQLSVFLNI